MCVPILGSNRQVVGNIFNLLELKNQVAQEVAQFGDLHLQNLWLPGREKSELRPEARPTGAFNTVWEAETLVK